VFFPDAYVGTGVIARKTSPISHYNSSCGVAIGHSLLKFEPLYSKFLLEMADSGVRRIGIF